MEVWDISQSLLQIQEVIEVCRVSLLNKECASDELNEIVSHVIFDHAIEPLDQIIEETKKWRNYVSRNNLD